MMVLSMDFLSVSGFRWRREWDWQLQSRHHLLVSTIKKDGEWSERNREWGKNKRHQGQEKRWESEKKNKTDCEVTTGMKKEEVFLLRKESQEQRAERASNDYCLLLSSYMRQRRRRLCVFHERKLPSLHSVSSWFTLFPPEEKSYYENYNS